MRRSLLFFIFISGVLSACAQTQQQPSKQTDPETGPFLIGTGNKAGLYHFLGQEICRSYGQAVAVVSSPCDALVQGNAEEKLRLLENRILDLAIVHSAWAQSAANGIGSFTNTGPMNDLRAVISFYPQPLSIIVKRNSGVEELGQLATARLVTSSISYNDATFKILRNLKGWTDNSFASLEKVKSTRTALDSFCNGEANAMLATYEHPSGIIRKATAECGGRLLPVEFPEKANEITGNPALAEASVPAKMYVGQAARISTFGHRTVLVARSDTPDSVIEAVVNSVLDDLTNLRGRHPAFLELNAREMASEGLAIPLHPAAQAIYRERRLLP